MTTHAISGTGKLEGGGGGGGEGWGLKCPSI